MNIKQRRRVFNSDKWFNALINTCLVIVLIIILYPLLYIVSASVSDPIAVSSGEMLLFPKGFTLEGYKTIFQNDYLWRGYANTIFYTLLGTSINLFVTIPAGYALSKPHFVGRGFFTNLMLVTMFISGGLIPSYLLVTRMGLGNTVWALVLPNAASVYNIIVTKTFFQTSIPEEIEEAAVMDGASYLTRFFTIILPLSKPIIAVMALFYGVGHWNSYFNALLYISDRDKYPLQMILREILVLQDLSSNPTMQMTGEMAEFLYSQQQLGQVIKYGVMIVATLPLIMVYPFLQKYFVKGVMLGSVKG